MEEARALGVAPESPVLDRLDCAQIVPVKVKFLNLEALSRRRRPNAPMLPKRIRIKFWFFENYWWILIVAAVVVAGIMIWLFKTENQVTTPLTLLGSIFSLLYFMQKQYRSKNLNDIKTLQKSLLLLNLVPVYVKTVICYQLIVIGEKGKNCYLLSVKGYREKTERREKLLSVIC